MSTETTKQKPTEIVEKRIQVELLHPINHDFILYSRGVHEVDESLGKLFCSLKCAVDKKPIAREFVAGQPPVLRGTTKRAK